MIRVETARPTPRPQAIPRADFPYLGAPMERILVVEDDRAVQKALKRLFESEGFAVEISADGKSALDAFRATGPAAIVLDLRLPSMSGRDVCREIKQQSPAVPVIVLSAASDVSDKVLLLELGADDYVTKPFSPRELLARVRAALRRTTRTGTGELVAFAGISVDFTKMEVTRDGQPVHEVLGGIDQPVTAVRTMDEVLELAAGQDVGARVPDVAQRHLAARPEHGGECGAHPADRRVDCHTDQPPGSRARPKPPHHPRSRQP